MLNALRTNRLIAYVVGLLLAVPFAGLGQTNPKEAARAAKLTPDLLNIQLKAEGKPGIIEAPATTDGLVKVDRTLVRDGKVAIEAISATDDAQALLRDLQAMGLTEGVAHKRLVFGYLPVDKLGQLGALANLRVARPFLKPSTNVGAVTSQGDQSMRSDVARQTFNVTGAGTKVGILSDSYNALGGAAAGVASGDLPADVQVIDDQPAGQGSDEGRAMAEIVHDVAPGASLAFASAFRGQAGFANNILRLADAGCNVIVDDVIYLAEPFFQDGVIAQAVNQVAGRGVAYFSSAGNNGRDSYQSAFNNSRTLPPADPFFFISGQAHDFGSGAILQRIRIAPGASFEGIFQWSDPFASVSGGAGARTDIDVFVYYNGVLRPDLSSYASNVGGDPIEGIFLQNNSNAIIAVQIAIVKYSGPDPSLIKWVNFGGVGASAADYTTRSSTTYGHANAEGAIAVGAARYNTTPPFNTTLAAPVVENFSSAGGTPILFDTNGNAIPPVVRPKPEITGPDGGNTTFFIPGLDLEGDGFPNFFGTSASAPHAAAVGALIRQRAGNTFSLGLLRDRLQSTAIDMDDPLTTGFDTGFDLRTGSGFIQADRALNFGFDPLTLLQPTYNCQTGEITFRTSGGDGTPIVFTAIGVQRDSPTSPTGIVEPGLRADPKPIVITATQSSVTVSYTFDFGAYCAGDTTTTPPPPPPAGGALTLTQPTYDCQTGAITFNVSGGDGTPITYTAIGVQRTDATSPTGFVEPGLRADPKPIVITATQSGVTVSYTFDFGAYCAGGSTPTPPTTGETLTMAPPTYNCTTGVITFNTSGGDGTPITYTAIGVQRADMTSNSGTIEPGLRADPKPIVITATQSAITVSYTFNFGAYCAGARVAAGEPDSGLDVKILGNPVPGEWADVEIRGAQDQPLQLRLSNGLGALTSEEVVETAGTVERYRMRLGRAPGLYLLQVSTPTQTKTVKIIRQQ